MTFPGVPRVICTAFELPMIVIFLDNSLNIPPAEGRFSPEGGSVGAPEGIGNVPGGAPNIPQKSQLPMSIRSKVTFRVIEL